MGKPKEAVDSLAKYLEEDPKTPDRTTVETRIANLKKRAEAQAPPPAASSAPPAASAAPPPPVSSASPIPPPTPAKGSPKRTPAYIALGVGGAAAIGAVVTGLVANGKFKDAEKTCSPRCSDDKVNSIKSMALVSDVFTGVAIVGVGVGAVLFFTAKPSDEAAASLRPAVQAGVGPGGGKVEATWHF
jgi:hypothetical protein